MSTLTDEQIENWRNALAFRFGPYAFIMPVEQIQRLHDAIQTRVSMMAEKEEPACCACDTKKHGYTKHKNGITCNKCQKPREVSK